jgi:hypothetical protein
MMNPSKLFLFGFSAFAVSAHSQTQPTPLVVETGIYCTINDIPEVSRGSSAGPCELVVSSEPQQLVTKYLGPLKFGPDLDTATYYEQLPTEIHPCAVITPSQLNRCRQANSAKIYHVIDSRSLVRTWGSRVGMVKIAELPSGGLEPNVNELRRLGPIVPSRD